MTHPTAWRAEGCMIFGTIFHPVYQKPIETVIASVLPQPTGHVGEGHVKNDAARKEAAKLAVLMAGAPKLLAAVVALIEGGACWCENLDEDEYEAGKRCERCQGLSAIASAVSDEEFTALTGIPTLESGPLGRPDPLTTPGV